MSAEAALLAFGEGAADIGNNIARYYDRRDNSQPEAKA